MTKQARTVICLSTAELNTSELTLKGTPFIFQTFLKVEPFSQIVKIVQKSNFKVGLNTSVTSFLNRMLCTEFFPTQGAKILGWDSN